jgi:hypothetical protein
VFEKEIERLLSLVVNRTIGTSEKISVKEVLAGEIPLPLRTLIRVDVEQKLIDELKSKFVNSRFDFSHPEVISLQQQMNSVLVLNYTFLRKEYLETVHDALHLMLNYLIRPQWTLVNFIFDKTTQVSNETIMQSLKHFGAYDYLKEIIVRIITEKNIKLLTQSEFQTLVWKCDREFIRRRDGYQLAQIASVIYDFVNFGQRETKIPILTKGLVRYFDDKGLKIVSERLRKEIQRNVNEIALDDLSVILEDLRRESGQFELENLIAEAEKKAEQPVREDAQTGREISLEPEAKLNSADYQSQDKQQTQNEVKETSTKKINLDPIGNFIDDIDQKRFIKKIFNKNENEYIAAITEINNMSSWKQASVYIDEIFIMNEIDPYTPEAVRFTEIAYRRFFPKSTK